MPDFLVRWCFEPDFPIITILADFSRTNCFKIPISLSKHLFNFPINVDRDFRVDFCLLCKAKTKSW